MELNVKIFAKSGKKYSITASSLTIGTQSGEITILPDHTNYFTLVEPSIIKISSSKGINTFVVSAGFLFTEENSISIFVNDLFFDNEIDREIELKIIKELEERITQNGTIYDGYQSDSENLKEATAKVSPDFDPIP